MQRRKAEDKSRKKPARTARTDAGLVRKRGQVLKGVKTISPYDIELLRKFLTEHGKVIPARLTGASSKQQRKIKRYIRRNQVVGLLP